MGTLLQEFGHDVVLLYFIEKVLKGLHDELFFIVSPANRPRIDIHFWNPDKNEYTSACNLSGSNYIPEFDLMYDPGLEILERLDMIAGSSNQTWYKELSVRIGKDIRDFVREIWERANAGVGLVPDIIGVDEEGKQTVWAEVKFEGFSQQARNSVITQYEQAKKHNVPFLVVIPRKPTYARELTDGWLLQNLPSAMTIFKFHCESQNVVPRRDDIKFVEVGGRKQYEKNAYLKQRKQCLISFR